MSFGQPGFTNRNAKPLNTSAGGAAYLLVNSTAATYPQGTQPTYLGRLVNSGAAQTAALKVYDSATPASPQASELIFSIVLGANAVVDLEIPLVRGLSVQMAGALTASTVVLVTWA